MSLWYIFRIFQTFSTLVILTFNSFSTMFYVTSLMIFLNSYGQFYYLNLFYLITLIRSHILFLISFRNTHSGEDELLESKEDDHRRTIHNKEQEKYEYLQVLQLPHLRSLGWPQPQPLLPLLPTQSQTYFKPPPHHSEVSLG